MFICSAPGFRQHASKPREKRVLVPVETRTKQYTKKVLDKYSAAESEVLVGSGHETVREVACCQDHADQLKLQKLE